MPKNTKLSKKHVAHLEMVRRQTQAIKIGATVLIILVVGLVGYGILINSVFLPYRPVASVNGEAINVADFQTEVKFERVQLINQIAQDLQYAQMFGVTDPMNNQNFASALNQVHSQLNASQDLGQKALNAQIDNMLIRQEARKRNIVVATADVDKAVQEGLGYYANGTPTSQPTEAATQVEPTLNPTQQAVVTLTSTPSVTPTETPSLTPTIDPSITPSATPTAGPSPTNEPYPTSTPYTLQGFQDTLKQEMDGMKTNADVAENDYRKHEENNVYRQKLYDTVVADLKPVQEQVWVRHILVDTEDAAKKVLDRLTKGEDFGKVAAEVSQDTATAAKGGDMGWLGRSAKAKEFDAAAFALKIGEISQPVKTTGGYEVIQALGHENRPLNATDFKAYQDQTFSEFLQALHDAAKIETYDLWKDVVPTKPVVPPNMEQIFTDAQQQQQAPGLPGQ